MGYVVVKYKVTINQPEDGRPDYEGIADTISSMEEVQTCEIKPLAFGMMFIEVQAVLGEGPVEQNAPMVRRGRPARLRCPGPG